MDIVDKKTAELINRVVPDGAYRSGLGKDYGGSYSRPVLAINALRDPDPSLSRVPNTIRQSIAEVIEDLVSSLKDSDRKLTEARAKITDLAARIVDLETKP